jgi:hypothetical protein
MLQVRGNRKRLDGIVRKLLGENSVKLLTKFLTRLLPRSPLEFPAHKFEPVRLGTSEPLHGQDQALFGVVGNGQHPACHVESFRPKAQERLFAVSPDFPGQAACERGAAAIFVQIHGSGSQKFSQARFEFSGEIHRRYYN